MARHLTFLQSLDLKFIHRPGELIPVSDTLSRDPRWNQVVKLSDEECEKRVFDPADMSIGEGHGRFANLEVADPGLAPQKNPTPGIRNANIMKIGTSPISAAQLEDGECRTLRHFKEHNKFLDGNLTSEQKKKLVKVAAQLEVKDDMLMHPLTEKGMKFSRYVPFVPLSLRSRILDVMHADPAAGHQGVEKTKHRIAQRFWWPTLQRDHSRSCWEMPYLLCEQEAWQKSEEQVDPYTCDLPTLV